MVQRMEFGFSFGPSTAPRVEPRGPMRLLLLGDFSAKPSSQKPALADRPSHRIDFDTFDAVMRRLGPQLELPAGVLCFETLDDFHPEQLYARSALFQELRQARSQPLGMIDGSALDQLLGKPSSAKPASGAIGKAQTDGTGLDQLIRSFIAPHIVPDQSAERQTHHRAVDTVITEQMRRLLHEPSFQSLESAWRGVQWLIANLELDETLELHLFDVSREELLADIISAQGQLAHTGLHQALVDRWRHLPAGQSWSALVGLYQFGASETEVGLLAAMGLLAAQAGGPLLTSGHTNLARLEGAELANWQALRSSEAAPWIGLAAARVLLRLPYGKKTDPVEGFAFEEFEATPVHEEFLWGNAALALAILIGRSFHANGWDFECDDEREIGDLPAFTFLQDGERELQACAERYLSEEEGLSLLAAGLMPLMSHRHRNSITVMRMQSAALPAQALPLGARRA